MWNWLNAILYITMFLIITIDAYRGYVKQRKRLQKQYAEQQALMFKYYYWSGQYRKAIKYGAPSEFRMYCYKNAEYYQIATIGESSATISLRGTTWI